MSTRDPILRTPLSEVDAPALLLEIGTDVLDLDREHIEADARAVRDYTAKAVGSRNMNNRTIERRSARLREILDAPSDATWPQLMDLVAALKLQSTIGKQP